MTADPTDRADRPDRHQSPGLLAWTLGTFHACAIVLLLLLLVYPRGGLGLALGGLDTVTGLIIFIALWATSVWTARRALAGSDWLSATTAERTGFYRRALRWGGVTGILFLAELGAIILVRTLLVAHGDNSISLLAVAAFAAFVGSFGTIVAFLIGALIGVTLGAVDLVALDLARRTVRSSGRPR